MLKLDLGAGTVSPEGFVPLGNVNGTQIFPLPSIPDASCNVIRASHVLEHFPHGQIALVLKEWVRCLKPGGVLKIAVPDFGKIAENYVAGTPQMTQGYVMGGQSDAADYHKAIFDRASLAQALAAAGLMLIRPWASELSNDCAALPISLNLEGTKPQMDRIGVTMVMSVPRLGFMDNFVSVAQAMSKHGFQLRVYQGAFWHQCIERVIETAIVEDEPDAILAIDYDSVFTSSDIGMLAQLLCCHPEADAIAAIQAGRGSDLALMTVHGRDHGVAEGAFEVSRDRFAGDLFKAATAHFGLTILRAEKFKTLRKPWFYDRPAADNSWNDGRVDADIAFWRNWEAAGHSLYLANRVAIGHLELGVLWPGEDLRVIHQPIKGWRDSGKPKECWT